MKPEIIIINWYTAAIGFNEYSAPETIKLRLCGNVLGHPELKECEEIISSEIINLDLKNRMVETRNSIYILKGPPEENWVNYLINSGYDLNFLPD